MELLGEIVRLQVQRESLKAGQKPRRYYEPAGLVAVPSLVLDDGGATGYTAACERVPDVHHRDHPASRYRGENALSILFTGHYDLMRGRFGDHLVDGVAGESILVRRDAPIVEGDLAAGVVIATADGREVRLAGATVAEPCVEFTRFALRHPPGAPSDRGVAVALDSLRRGVRGYYLSYDGPPARIGVGDRVYRP